MFLETALVMNFLWGVVTGWGVTEVFHGVFDEKPVCACTQQVQEKPCEDTICLPECVEELVKNK